MLNKRKMIAMAGLSALLATTSISLPASASDERLAESLCGYIAADDASRLRKKLRDNKLRLRNIYDAVLCEGSSMLKFALERGANDAGEFIARKVAPQTLESAGPDGWIILQWAEKQGLSDSPIVSTIKQRING